LEPFSLARLVPKSTDIFPKACGLITLKKTGLLRKEQQKAYPQEPKDRKL
jgi:hypothetical protein